MALFKNKYRIGSARYPYWDYGFDGAYFITINTKNRVPYFGNITNGLMVHSPIGDIANMMWHEIKNHAKNVKLGEFIVMPDHIHGIIILDGNNDPRKNNACGKNNDPRKNNACVVSTPDACVVSTYGQLRYQNLGKNTISSIIGGYKSAVSKHARRMGFEFSWQPLFYDRIIRDEYALECISRYIIDNPKNYLKKGR